MEMKIFLLAASLCLPFVYSNNTAQTERHTIGTETQPFQESSQLEKQENNVKDEKLDAYLKFTANFVKMTYGRGLIIESLISEKFLRMAYDRGLSVMLTLEAFKELEKIAEAEDLTISQAAEDSELSKRAIVRALVAISKTAEAFVRGPINVEEKDAPKVLAALGLIP